MSQKRIYTKQEIDTMIQMYLDGETYAKIALQIHSKQDKVSKYLKTIGYGKRPKNTLKYHDFLNASRKNKLNEHFFDTIDTENKAYWLGFLYADGYVCKKHDKNGNAKGGSIELALKFEDTYHIQNFLYDIESSAPIARRKIVLDGKEYLASRVSISSIIMVNDLIRHGCVQNKSLTLLPPTTVPDDLIHHFIRGYFDGDGCVGFYPDRYAYTYNILGTEEFLKFISEKSSLPSYSIRGFDNKRCFSLYIYSKNGVAKFHNYIYKDKSIYLDRKYQKSLSMMRYCELDTSRNNTQKMADLLDSNLSFNDSLLNDFESYIISSETAAMADLLD